MRHRPPYVIELTIVRDGKVLEHRVQRPHTLVDQFFQILAVRMDQLAVANVRDQSGVLRTVHPNQIAAHGGGSSPTSHIVSTNLDIRSFIEGNMIRRSSTSGEPFYVDAKQGIALGSSTAATIPSTFDLQTLITNGDGLGQLHYGACAAHMGATSGGARRLFITRTFYNASEGTVTVNEVGLYCKAATSVSTILTTWHFFLIERTVLDTPLEVTSGSLALVRYRWST